MGNLEGVFFMSKKKKRFQKLKKRKQKRVYRNNAKDLHHLLWPRRDWKGGAIWELRKHWYCSVLVPRDTVHREIHHYVKKIPTPKYCNAKSALAQLNYLEKYGALHKDDPIEKRLKVLIALFECADEETADALKAQLEIVNRICKKPS